MWEVATTLQQDAPPQADSNDDKLSWTMVFIRAAETLNIRRMERAAAAYPYITSLIHPGDPNARIHPNFQALRNHAKDLAHQQLTDELLQAQRTDDHLDQHTRQHKKQQLVTRLARLIPGATNNIGAILTEDDELATTPTAIAEALKKHWEPIFRHRPVNTQMLHDWLSSTTNFHDNSTAVQTQRSPRPPPPRFESTSTSTSRSASPTSSSSSNSPRQHTNASSSDGRTNASQANPAQNYTRHQTDAPRTSHTRPHFPKSERDWQIRRKDITKAIKMSGHSAPGPDGIPFGVWRTLGEIGVEVLMDILS